MDVFPEAWLLLIAPETCGSVQLQTAKGFLEVRPGTALFVPPYAITRWLIGPGAIHWRGVWSTRELPNTLKAGPFAFSWSEEFVPSHVDDLIQKLAVVASTALALPSELTSSIYAKKAKNYIDLNYQDEDSMKWLMKVMGKTPSSVSHLFSRCYGISPIKYRNLLRVRRALIDLSVHGAAVTDACYEAGFGDFSRFFLNFREAIGGKPSAFKRRNFSGPVNLQGKL